MLAFDLERLDFLDARNMDVAVAIGVLKFAVVVVIGIDRDTVVVDPDFFLQRRVVVHQHPARADDRGAADLVGVKPAYVDERNHVVGKSKVISATSSMSRRKWLCPVATDSVGI